MNESRVSVDSVCDSRFSSGCPARVRTWAKGFKVLCATTTQQGSVETRLAPPAEEAEEPGEQRLLPAQALLRAGHARALGRMLASNVVTIIHGVSVQLYRTPESVLLLLTLHRVHAIMARTGGRPVETPVPT